MIENKYKNILVDFSMLVDIDEACIKYLLKTYPTSPYFLDYMKTTSDYYIRYALLTRKDFNPLSILFKDEYLSSIDDLYTELRTTKWEEILDLSQPTDIFKFLNTTIHEAGYNVTINCSNLLEQKKIETYTEFMDKNWKISIDCKDIKKFFCIFIKNLGSLKHIKKIEGKTIYIYDYAPNYSDYKKKEIDPILALLGKTNILKFIFPYSGFEFPIDETITYVEENKDETSNERS